MITKELTDFIQTELAAGTSRGEIRRLLLSNNWSEQDITEAFGRISPAARPRVPAAQPPHAGRKLLLSCAFIAASAAYAGWTYAQGTSQPQLAVGNTTSFVPQQTATNSTTSATTTPAPVQTESQTQSQSAQASATATKTATKPTVAVATTPSKPATTPTPTPTPTPAPAPKPKPTGQYIDGTYTGSPADAYYGTIQVRATVSGGKLTNVAFLQYPNDRSTSIYINSQAMPILKDEAIQAQSARVDGVSGATDSSQAFIESLSSALAKAKA